MITLFHCVAARSFRPLWALEELELAYELKMLPFPPRALDRGYLSVNPLGTVPGFFDGELRMTESSAICQYLAACYGEGRFDVAPGEPEFGAYLNWLHFGEATLTFPQTLILRYGRFEAPERRAPQVVTDYTRWFLGRLRTLEPVLEGRTYLCGERFTMADISVGYALLLADYLGLADEFAPALARYLARLKERPAFRRAQEAEAAAAREQGVSTLPAPLTLP
ncbi:glutathione S-transferase family protein [Massilia sp. Mn16-1_5]|uniref:glutathione S-transferase family protein n=1 Tax=Massilia sp. Mn16-1_5 TaxID=2079199 RepID=UPI00109E78ED|nr:glutathione S-transferase family protein [Massilia sp. Mn16-1_5]THC45368.1 glutathione S-transferase [Massilia sp. Mn16-1_5]